MNRFEKEIEFIAYCGHYCRLCDYFTDKIREVAKQALEMVEQHTEFKTFAEITKAFSYEELVKGLKWMATQLGPCIGTCRGGGGWEECPIRKCCIEREVDFCYECGDFPCDTIKKYPKAGARLRELKELGAEKWIKKQLGITD